MKLVSSADALDFLSKSAPRAWVKRMLLWMIFDGPLTPYFTNGRVTPYTHVGEILGQVAEIYKADQGPARDKVIRDSFDAEIADRLIGANILDLYFDTPIEWGDGDEPHAMSAGFLILADELDWEAGKLSADILYPLTMREPFFWDDDEHLGSEFERANFKVELGGFCFDKDAIEMMLPTSDLGALSDLRSLPHSSPIGRPPKWDWEGAFAYLASIAQHPDGLPTGTGAQAQIEKLIAEWFVQETSDSPVTSQIRQRAQKMMKLLDRKG